MYENETYVYTFITLALLKIVGLQFGFCKCAIIENGRWVWSSGMMDITVLTDWIVTPFDANVINGDRQIS